MKTFLTLLGREVKLIERQQTRRLEIVARATNSDGTAKASDTSEVQSNVIESWSMSWWGFQKGPAAALSTPRPHRLRDFSTPMHQTSAMGNLWLALPSNPGARATA